MKHCYNLLKRWCNGKFSRQILLTLLLLLLGLPGPAESLSLKNRHFNNFLDVNYTNDTGIDAGNEILRRIQGTVVDEAGQPIPGVAVLIKETNTGTVTNTEGEFSIEADEDDVLVFSFIGFTTQEVSVKGRTSFEIVLKENISQLKEIVVVGFGTQEKVSVTGSVASIPVQDLQRVSTPSLSNTLGGRLPGIVTRQSSGEPGYDAAQVFIRGLGTWANRAPLILVDGVERNMNTINAQAIESFSILKDASATAVYGVRGANGVILITTKRGEKGKPKVTFRTETARLTALRLPDYIEGHEYANLMNEARENVGQTPFFTQEEIEKFRTGTDPYLYPNVNWTDAVFKKHTFQSINNLSISGGGDIARYYTNVGYTLQNGIYKEDPANNYSTNAQIKRYNFRSNVDITVSKNLTVDLGLGGIIQHGNYPGTPAPGIFNALRIISPIEYPIKNPDGSVAGGLAILGANPWGQATQSGYTVQDRKTLQGTFGTTWDLSSLVTKGLSLRGKFAFDHYYAASIERHKAYGLKRYEGKDPVTGEDIYFEVREEAPLGYKGLHDANRAVYSEASVNYDREFNKHHVTGLLLYNRREYINLTAPNSTANLPFRREGLAGRLTYGFDERYLVELNVGYNGSENFPKGKRFGFFPSVSAGWIVSGEDFWHINSINHLKIRGSHGQVGNDQIGGDRFLYNTTINRQGQSYLYGEDPYWITGFEEALIGNPNVTWEVSTKTNIGLDLEMFNGKIVLQVDAFKESRNGILIKRATVPRVTGIYPWVIPYANLGKVKNKGIDGQLEVRNTTASGLFYSFRGTFSFARNEIVENDEPTPKWAYQAKEGKRIDQPFGLVSLGLFENVEEVENSPEQTFMTNVRPGDIKYKDINEDGVIDTYDRIAIGHPRTPEITFGLGGTVGYKGFELSAFFSGVANTSLFVDGPSMYPFQVGLGSHNVLREYYDNRWIPGAENADAKYPGVITADNPNNYRTSTHYLQDASFIRLKSAEIAYNLPESFNNKIGMSGSRIFINGTNLYTWDKIKVIDPESNYGTGGYPLQRAINVGVQLNF